MVDNTYNAAHLLVLEGLEAVRKRPGMYIGSTDTRGLMHCLWEIIDNGVDEALAGHATKVEVMLHPDDSVEVHDNGRGIPVDKEPKTGLTGVEVVFTKLHAGGKFGGGSYTATGGLHGVGLSVVNALSARLDVEVDRSPADAGDVLPARCPRRLRRRRAEGLVQRLVRAEPQGQAGGQGSSPAPASGSGRTGRSSPRTPRSPGTSWSPAPARPRSSCPGSSWCSPTGGAARRWPSPSATTAASPSSASSSPPTSPSPTCSGCRARTCSPRPCRCSTSRVT